MRGQTESASDDLAYWNENLPAEKDWPSRSKLTWTAPSSEPAGTVHRPASQREFVIDNLLARIHYSIVIIR